MPITPLHFGPGAAIHALAPRKISFLAFCAVNVLMDVEPLYYMLTYQHPLHRFLHTYVGASLMAATTVFAFFAARSLARRFSLPNPLKWQDLELLPVTAGAALGACSHVVLDSIMHHDIRPLTPFSAANPLLGVISLTTLHWACIVVGAIGLFIVGVKEVRDEAR